MQEAKEAVTHVVVVTVAQVDQAVALDRGLLAQQQVQLPADTSEAWLRALVSPRPHLLARAAPVPASVTFSGASVVDRFQAESGPSSWRRRNAVRVCFISMTQSTQRYEDPAALTGSVSRKPEVSICFADLF